MVGAEFLLRVEVGFLIIVLIVVGFVFGRLVVVDLVGNDLLGEGVVVVGFGPRVVRDLLGRKGKNSS
jgi:hypothetical protein